LLTWVVAGALVAEAAGALAVAGVVVVLGALWEEEVVLDELVFGLEAWAERSASCLALASEVATAP
jgi:hypothetical protein